MRHLITIDDLTTDEIIDMWIETNTIMKSNNHHEALKGRHVINLFYEPSTRTSSSFAAAVQRQGGTIDKIDAVSFSSVSKGETLQDTIRVLGEYCDLIVLRTQSRGDAELAAKYSSVPIINAGDGKGDHPTQTFLDGFTMYNNLFRFDELCITLVGDLKNGRTVHSIVKLLSRWESITFNFVSPENYRMPASLRELVTGRYYETESLEEVTNNTDVFYVTRVQRERGSDFSYTITEDNYKNMKEKAIILHPLPRNEEIPMWLDDKSQAKYFEQVKNGMWCRMTLLRHFIKG